MLDRYRLHRRLGTGGFATVWQAHDERLDREVAVKILARERIVGGRFDREARAAARLAHPGIVTLYEAAVDDEGAYLVSELVYGSTLDRLLAAGRLSDRDVVQIGIVLCDALAHAHAHRVIHRDVKPSNVLVPDRPTTPAQLARLTDFGVARVLGGDSLTRTGDVIGTAAYMAPEQAQGLPAGAAADLFSLALVLYEALSGVNPLRARALTDPISVNPRRLSAHLPPLRRQRRELPRELGRAIDLALRPRAAERGTLEELRAALVSAVARVDDEPGVVADPWPARTRDRRAREAGSADADRPLDPDRRTRADRGPQADRPPHADRGLEAETDQHPDDDRPAHEHLAPNAEHLAWPRRALAAGSATALTAWLAVHTPAAAPLPAAPAACLAAVLIAAAPRAGWLALIAAEAALLALHAHAGAAVILLAGGLLPAVLAPRDGPTWPLAATAPAIAAVHLATAWPALAGLAARPHRRAVLAAAGWIWIALWHGGAANATTLSEALHQVLIPLLTPSTAAICGAWALAALVLPWTRRRRSPQLEYVRVAAWATAVALVTVGAAHLGGAPAWPPVGAALAGAFAGALVTIVTRRVRPRLKRARSGEDLRPLA